MIIKTLTGFIGVVVNINGEGENFGKVQIRIAGDQGFDGDDSNLLWAFIMVPSTSPAQNGIGVTPNWLNVDSTVFGVFLDFGNHRNYPMILGALNQNKPTGHGISPLASGENIPRTLTGAESQINVNGRREPNYKDNKVITTSAKENPNDVNHIFEIDDTPENERILVKHKSGSYVEFFQNGDMVAKSANTNYEIAVKDKELVVYGDVTINCRNTVAVKASTITFDGPVSIFGSLSVDGSIRCKTGKTGNITDRKGQTISFVNGIIV